MKNIRGGGERKCYRNQQRDPVRQKGVAGEEDRGKKIGKDEDISPKSQIKLKRLEKATKETSRKRLKCAKEQVSPTNQPQGTVYAWRVRTS